MQISPSEAATELLERRRARNHLLSFCQYTMPEYQDARHIRILSEKLEAVERGDIKRLMVFMPPRHGKSEMVSIRFPAWYLGRNQQAQLIGCSYAESLAYTFSYAIRETISSLPYQRLWGLGLDKSGSVRWQLSGKDNKRDSYIAAGVGGGITGEGANVLLIDDPVKNSEEAESQVYRDKIWNWYTTTARTRLQPDGAIVLIMTRWHQDDLAGRLLQAQVDPKADQWEILHLKAIDNDNALWPEQYDIPALDNIRASIGSRAFIALYQGEPTAETGNILNRKWWKYYRQAPSKFETVIQSWDCTFKDSQGTDYVVGQVWGVIGADKYLLDQVRGRMDFPNTIAAIIALSAKWPQSRAKLIEDKANGSAVIATLKHKIAGLIPIEPEGGKVVRAQAVSPDVEAGNVWIPEAASYTTDFVEECAAFPNGSHDDQVDAMTQAINYIINKTPHNPLGIW